MCTYLAKYFIAGYQWSEIAACMDWMKTFVLVLKSDGPVALKSFDRISASESHNIQTRTTSAEFLACMSLL